MSDYAINIGLSWFRKNNHTRNKIKSHFKEKIKEEKMKESKIIKNVTPVRQDILRYAVDKAKVILKISSYDDSITLTINELDELVTHVKKLSKDE